MLIKKVCALSTLLLTGGLSANELDSAGPMVGELKHAFISSAYSESRAERFVMKASIAETLTGSSNDLTETVSLEAGLIKPNRDLIFMNDLEQE